MPGLVGRQAAPCRLCGSASRILQDSRVGDFEYGSKGHFDFYRCAQCGLLAISPIPSGDELAQAYPEGYHAYHEHSSWFARILKQRFWAAKAARYSRWLGPESRVLEVGCSFGDLLMALKERGIHRVRGLDFNAKAVEKAQSRGLEVHQGELETASLPEKHFDMIVMENFIEHVYDPIGSFALCHRLLKDAGYLVGETPNTNAWDFRLFGKHWGGYHAPRHLHVFNIQNLILLGEKTGFAAVRIANLLQPAHWALSVQNWLQQSRFKTQLKNGRSPIFGALLLATMPINVLQMLIAHTSSVEFVFRKQTR